MNQNIEKYYQERAAEYEKVYLNPLEQDDLQKSTTLFREIFAQKTVLEIACGTGYWTEQIAQTATSVLATDINENMIAIAQKKHHPGNVTYTVADMYHLPDFPKYEGIFGGFIWSHISLQHLDGFLEKLKSMLVPGGVIAFIDSKFVAGTSHDIKKITHTDEHNNTFQTRTLADGSVHQVLKNFPENDFLVEKLSAITSEVTLTDLEYYWIAVGK